MAIDPVIQQNLNAIKRNISATLPTPTQTGTPSMDRFSNQQTNTNKPREIGTIQNLDNQYAEFTTPTPETFDTTTVDGITKRINQIDSKVQELKSQNDSIVSDLELSNKVRTETQMFGMSLDDLQNKIQGYSTAISKLTANKSGETERLKQEFTDNFHPDSRASISQEDFKKYQSQYVENGLKSINEAISKASESLNKLTTAKNKIETFINSMSQKYKVPKTNSIYEMQTQLNNKTNDNNTETQNLSTERETLRQKKNTLLSNFNASQQYQKQAEQLKYQPEGKTITEQESALSSNVFGQRTAYVQSLEDKLTKVKQQIEEKRNTIKTLDPDFQQAMQDEIDRLEQVRMDTEDKINKAKELSPTQYLTQQRNIREQKIGGVQQNRVQQMLQRKNAPETFKALG